MTTRLKNPTIPLLPIYMWDGMGRQSLRTLHPAFNLEYSRTTPHDPKPANWRFHLKKSRCWKVIFGNYPSTYTEKLPHLSTRHRATFPWALMMCSVSKCVMRYGNVFLQMRLMVYLVCNERDGYLKVFFFYNAESLLSQFYISISISPSKMQKAARALVSLS